MARYRILLVDDDPDIRAVVGAALRTKFEIVEASDGLEALHKLPNYQPDFAIIDGVMPVMDGWELCEAIRKHRDFRAIPVMFLSASSSQESIRKGYASGANLYLTKPVDPMRVLKNIEFTIEHDKPEVRKKRFTLEELKHVDELEARRAPEEPEATVEPRSARAQPAAPPPVEVSANGIADSEELDYEPVLLEEESHGGAGGRRPRVMIVDNEEDSRQLMQLALREEYEITTAYDGVDAIEKIVKYQPDLVLLDVMMPKMNGYQLLQTIRRNRVYGLLPIIIVSGKATRRDREYALRLGATDTVAKPFTPVELLTAIEGVVRAPGFDVAPKRLGIDEIIEAERRASVDEQEKEARKEQYSGLKEILREEKHRTVKDH